MLLSIGPAFSLQGEACVLVQGHEKEEQGCPLSRFFLVTRRALPAVDNAYRIDRIPKQILIQRMLLLPNRLVVVHGCVRHERTRGTEVCVTVFVSEYKLTMSSD